MCSEHCRQEQGAVTGFARKKPTLFSRSGSEDRLKEYAEKNDILMVFVEDLYGDHGRVVTSALSPAM
jgi:hypothetical protein